MMNWLSSKNPKVHQRKINRFVRIMNRILENDPLWKGRFYMRQYGATYFQEYEDKSGGNLYVRFKLFDKQTGIIGFSDYESVNHWCFFSGNQLFELMNKFIIDIEHPDSFCSGPHITFQKPN